MKKLLFILLMTLLSMRAWAGCTPVSRVAVYDICHDRGLTDNQISSLLKKATVGKNCCFEKVLTEFTQTYGKTDNRFESELKALHNDIVKNGPQIPYPVRKIGIGEYQNHAVYTPLSFSGGGLWMVEDWYSTFGRIADIYTADGLSVFSNYNLDKPKVKISDYKEDDTYVYLYLSNDTRHIMYINGSTKARNYLFDNSSVVANSISRTNKYTKKTGTSFDNGKTWTDTDGAKAYLPVLPQSAIDNMPNDIKSEFGL